MRKVLERSHSTHRPPKESQLHLLHYTYGCSQRVPRASNPGRDESVFWSSLRVILGGSVFPGVGIFFNPPILITAVSLSTACKSGVHVLLHLPALNTSKIYSSRRPLLSSRSYCITGGARKDSVTGIVSTVKESTCNSTNPKTCLGDGGQCVNQRELVLLLTKSEGRQGASGREPAGAV